MSKMWAERNYAESILKEIKMNEDKKEKFMQYRCCHCGYIYDPSKGCEKNNVKPNTSFEEVPEEYRCPVCKSKKSGFVPIK